MKSKLLLFFFTAIQLTLGAVAHADSCGAPPPPPPELKGKARCVPVCNCDKSGKNCYWVFHCS